MLSVFFLQQTQHCHYIFTSCIFFLLFCSDFFQIYTRIYLLFQVAFAHMGIRETRLLVQYLKSHWNVTFHTPNYYLRVMNCYLKYILNRDHIDAFFISHYSHKLSTFFLFCRNRNDVTNYSIMNVIRLSRDTVAAVLATITPGWGLGSVHVCSQVGKGTVVGHSSHCSDSNSQPSKLLSVPMPPHLSL